jgi:hypothetical protein
MRPVGEHWVPRCRPRGLIHTTVPCTGEFLRLASSSPLSARRQIRPSEIHRTLPLLPRRRRRPVWLFRRSGLRGSGTLFRTLVQVLCDLTTPGHRHLRSGVLRLFHRSPSLGMAHRLDNPALGVALLRVLREEDRPMIPTTLSSSFP